MLFCLLSVHAVYAQNAPTEFLTDSVTYIWPTDASRYLSSTFAETRSAHLHSGIDIRTWGREGYKVFAARDGYVYRIGMGPSGYGNVIYLRHADGSFTVYAHLNRFEPDLQAYADSIRLIDYRFELDHYPRQQQIYYKQGDVIGFSGSTGVGPPHLHFEIRSPDYTPINPLLSNLSVADNLPPVFSRLAVEYLDSGTLHRTGHSVIPVRNENGAYHFGEITVSGPAGLAVNVHDRANRTPNVYAVHSLVLVSESDTLFKATADYFSFANGNNMFLDRSYPILSQTRRGYQRLYKVSANRLPFYSKSVNEGVLDLPEGTHELQIVARDIYGNESTAGLTVRSTASVDKPLSDGVYIPAYPSFEFQNPYPLYRWDTDFKRLSNLLLASSSSGLSVTTQASSQPVLVSAERMSARKTIAPGEYDILHTPNQKLWLQFSEASLFDSLDVKVSISENPASGDLSVAFSPTDLPLQQPVILNMILPDNMRNQDGLALYEIDHNRDRESFIPSRVSGGVLRAGLTRIRDLRLDRDNRAPWTGTPSFKKNLAGQHILVIPTVDRDSGINYRKSTILINGERGIIEYDPDRDWLIYYHPEFTPDASNEITYEVFDGVGNSRTGSATLRAPQ
ncbi:M23 family metallopeptidase [Rhodohalobacter mucosus]|uniref:M23 family metallopeptidase n=1 Tax=Rhodohalobacter mucosus TaxID=2079485 RepID=UPI001FA86F9A|nr:M23 family metallopeptidase [Rhodohalobacter mucosus]